MLLSCVHVLHNREIKETFTRRSRAVTGKKCTLKKRDARAELLFC